MPIRSGHCATQTAPLQAWGNPAGNRQTDVNDHTANTVSAAPLSPAHTTSNAPEAASAARPSPPRAPRRMIQRPAEAATRSAANRPRMQTPITPASSVAPAEAANHRARSGSEYQRSTCTARVGGLAGPSISDTSTTDSENVSTASTGSLTWGQIRGSTASTQARQGPYLSAPAARPESPASDCASAASNMSNRYGVSFSQRPSTSAKPQGSCTNAMSGGVRHPVSHGETPRAAHPLGAARNANPIASAECGVANTGGIQARIARSHPARRASTVSATADPSDRIVAAIPVVTVRNRLPRNPGHASSSRQGAHEKASPPSAGRYPNAGNKVAARPASTGNSTTEASNAAGETSLNP